MKVCKYCNKTYPEMDFGIAKTTPDKIYRRNKCRNCYRQTKNILKDKRRGWLSNFKAELGCKDCNNKDHRVLDFHHKAGTEKEFAISDYFYHQFCENRLRAEIKKCEILCANCHRIHHYNKNQK